MTRDEFKNTWIMFQRRQELKYFSSINRAVKAQFAKFFETKDVNSISAQGMHDALYTLRTETALSWGKKINSYIKQIKSGSMGFSDRIYELMKDYFGIDLLNDAEGITANIREYIRIALSEGALQGLSFDNIVAKMQKDVPELSAVRARRIARTETVAAANKAGLVVAQDSKVVLQKQWLAVHDKRTRPDHILADGQQIPLEDKFNVGGYGLDHPGDRGEGWESVPGRETVNCRCTVAYEGVRDANGRLIRRV